MLSIIATLCLLQMTSIAGAIAAKDPFPEMVMALNDPANVLVAPKRSSPQAANPNFETFDSTYWLVDYTYSSASCSSSVVLKFGVATNYCFQTGPSSSLMYQCTSVSSCTVNICNTDPTCTISTNVIPFNLGSCTSTDADDDGYLTDDGAVFTKQQTLAVQGYPTGFSDGSSGVMTYYESQTCAQSSMYVYRIGYENHCYSNYDGTDYTSGKYSNPNLMGYTGVGCEPANIVDTTPMPSGACQIDDATSSSMMTHYTNGGKDSLSAGAIAGIVIGCVAGVAIIAALVYFFVFHQAKAPLGQQGAASSSNV